MPLKLDPEDPFGDMIEIPTHTKYKTLRREVNNIKKKYVFRLRMPMICLNPVARPKIIFSSYSPKPKPEAVLFHQDFGDFHQNWWFRHFAVCRFRGRSHTSEQKYSIRSEL